MSVSVHSDVWTSDNDFLPESRWDIVRAANDLARSGHRNAVDRTAMDTPQTPRGRQSWNERHCHVDQGPRQGREVDKGNWR